jgi:hypothetical protein
MPRRISKYKRISWESKGVTSGFGAFAIVAPALLQQVQETKMIVVIEEDGFVPPSPVHRIVPGGKVLYL